MSKTVLITGAGGFIGSKLLGSLAGKGFKVKAADLNLHDYGSIARVLSEPCDVVIHLAALSHVPTCEKDRTQAFMTNVNGTAMVLDAVLEHNPRAHLICASTAQVYERPKGAELVEGVSFDESRAIAPQNTYARTKWGGELLLRDAAQRRGLLVTVLRLFNHSHKSQSADFFLPHIYSLLSKARPGEEIVVPVGNLDNSRDIGSVPDLLTAFEALLAKRYATEPFEVFNICSGTPKNLRRLAEGLAEHLDVRARFEVDPSRVRADEPRSICGSHRRFTEATGWKPTCTSEEELLRQFLA